ncbi:MAG: hypothetical protein RIS20_1143 [Bacteroidota bacterium]
MNMKFIRSKSFMTCICFIWLAGIISSCGTYYKLGTVSYARDQKLMSEITQENTVVFVHSTDELLQLSNVKIVNNVLEGTLIPINQAELSFFHLIQSKYSHQMYFDQNKVNEARYKAAQEQLKIDTLQLGGDSLNNPGYAWNEHIHQIHLYSKNVVKNEQRISIDLKAIDQVAFFKKTRSAGTIFATVVLGGSLILLILLAIACNCPHVYVQNGDTFEFTNTLFTGALSDKIERFDYKTLQDFYPDNASIFMQIKNEENEKQFTNLLGLKVAYHDPSFEVMTDKNGKLYSISSPTKPIHTVDQENMDQLESIAMDDESYFSFDTRTKNGLVSTLLSFKKPSDASNAKLILNLKNSEWSGYIHQKFLENLGSYQKEWLESNSNKTAEQQQQALKKGGIPLVVYMKKKNKWIEVETIQPVGNVSDQSIVIPIDEKLLTEPTIEIRLQSGFKFWDLDYVAMDFTKQKEFEIQTIQPSFVSGNERNLQALSMNDKSYIATESGSEAISVRFDGIKTNKNRTLFLESKGYYIRSKMETNDPKWMELAKMSRKNGLGRFSQETFLKTMMSIQQLNLTSAANK